VREIGRSIDLDVHRYFCEVAIAEAGEVRSAGRVETTPERLELFAQSLHPRDRVALEGDRQRVGGRADPRTECCQGRGRQSGGYRHQPGTGEDRPLGCAHAGEAVLGAARATHPLGKGFLAAFVAYMPRVTAVSAKISRLSEGSAKLVKRIGVRVLLTATLAATLAGCGSSGSTSTKSTSTSTAATTTTSAPATKSISLSVGSLPTVGAVLVDAEGRTLYIFEPDKHSKVTCVSSCASLWPPLKLSSGQSAVGPIQLKASLLGSDPDPEGGRVVTYAGWPLYTYAADTAVGQDNGQGIETNGGLWYVISPSGTVITTKP